MTLCAKRQNSPEISFDHHELNGISPLKDFFEIHGRSAASRKVKGTIHWHYFGDNQRVSSEDGRFTFYDARAKSAHRTGRSEWRMYYSGEFLSCAEPGDVLVLARKEDVGIDDVHALVFEQDSGWLQLARALFSIAEISERSQLIPENSLGERTLELSRQLILEEIGEEIEELHTESTLPVSETDEVIILDKFGRSFPTTREMSRFARERLETEEGFDPEDADGSLVRWITREEELFRALEKVIVESRLEQGFDGVDDFISFSLSVHNRRKSRMGHAFENHLAALLDIRKIKYSKQPVTEGKNKPDFLFPGIEEYKDENYAGKLAMLAAKSSCKDRWRQILVEAQKIPDKHLCTLDQAISSDQVIEMGVQHTTLVIPVQLRESYTPEIRDRIMMVEDFIEFVEPFASLP